MTCEFIWNEYALLFTSYEAFNSHSLTLKSWSVTTVLAGMIAAYSRPVGNNGRIALCLATFATIPFYLIDALFKTYQKAYLPRLESLEKASAEAGCAHGFNIFGSWENSSAWSSTPEDLMNMLGVKDPAMAAFVQLNVLTPHLFILLSGLALIFLFPPSAR